jgi:hypothetical protein
LAAEEPDLTAKGVRVHIGDRPFAVDVKRLCTLAKQRTPKVDIFAAFDLWIATYTVGVVSEGSRHLSRLGFQVRYNLPENPDLLILQALPDSRFLKTAGGEIKCAADVGLSGEAKLPEELQNVLGLALPQIPGVGFGLGGSVEVEGSFFVRLGFSVLTPLITTIGVGSRAGEWLLTRDARGLVGTNVFQHLLLVPRNVTQLPVMARVYGTIRGFFSLPVRVESPEMPLTCGLLS